MFKQSEEINFEHSGLKCKCVRVSIGDKWWWCGYVQVPYEHTWFAKEYDADGPRKCEVHGGITYAGDKDREGSWWFGFDTAHSGDMWEGSKQYDYEKNLPGARTWTIDDLIIETKRLADQIYLRGETDASR